jgi:hypothetical protein
VSQRTNVTVDVSSGSKCHGGQYVGGRNVKAPVILSFGHKQFFCSLNNGLGQKKTVNIQTLNLDRSGNFKKCNAAFMFF